MENEYAMGGPEKAWSHIKTFEVESAGPDYDPVRDRWSMRMDDLKAVMLVDAGDLATAAEVAKKCLKTAEGRKFKKYIGKAHRLLGQIAAERGEYDEGQARLRSALEYLEQVGNPKQLWLTRTALAHLYAKMNRSDLERAEWQAAAAIVRSTAEGLMDEALRGTFLAAAPVREILEHARP
jgi:tetratricopeptide (TPR) repeat protein